MYPYKWQQIENQIFNPLYSSLPFPSNHENNNNK
jgi:hypothetical protein